MQITFPQRRGQLKPYGSIPRINWSHPLALNLVSYCYDTGSGPVDLVNGSSRTIVNSTNLTGSKSSAYGSGFLYNGTGTTGKCAVSLPTAPRLASLTNTAPWSFAAGLMSTATSGLNAIVFCLGDATVNNPVGIGVNSTAGLGDYFLLYANATFQGTGAATQVLGSFQTVLGVATTSSQGRVYLNGILKNSPSTATTLTQAGVQPQFNGFSTATQTQKFFNGFVYYGAMWKRILTAQEARWLHDDPYCFLIYPEDEMFATNVGFTAAVTPSIMGFNPKWWEGSFETENVSY